MENIQWVLEWSKKQNAFHIQELSRSLARNQKQFIENGASDYIPIMVGTKEVCHQMADHWRDRLKDRSGVPA